MPSEKTAPKYLIVSGTVLSKNDKQQHRVTANELIHLYGVNPSECLIYNTVIADRIGHEQYERQNARAFAGLKRLYPRADGNYGDPQ